jgi:hypothetical protein
VTHLVDDVADPHGALRGVHLVEHPLLATPFAGDAHEPTRERSERLVESLGAGRKGIVAIAAPVPCGGGLAGHATPALFGSESGQVRGSASEILKQPAARQRIW